jgi:hypothetical protein
MLASGDVLLIAHELCIRLSVPSIDTRDECVKQYRQAQASKLCIGMLVASQTVLCRKLAYTHW